ncbi:MAG TPA: hypothetical protein VK804_02720 [Bradyrhizobium sp.]|jgi:hypothetical protein|uniref:hypothetical protein n=1 Tax=Bradyrhizobium sp. TaxID=376 RepID=UPI002C0D812A|nr:hypothetical protein [Bradyrhizobium sp.]HTA99363.1 hypothetical protein [Bradyrhizobium sp.]
MTDAQVEQLANELCALKFDGLAQAEIDARILAIVGDLVAGTSRAVLDRAAEIMGQRVAAAARQAETLQTIGRLANATQCPDDVDAVTWLEGLGLIEPDGAGGYVLTPQAATRAIDKDAP